ncbi:MAG: CDP-alcohol phosphatidyltransferase family protein [Candidatus Acidoferrales bacterium]|nr:CDP-alcohol phosphatidyltransferase family protein [Candidatus Acidoferrales bacterium]
MTPNRVSAARVVAAFAAVALFSFGADALAADLAAVLLTVAAIALDGLDGYLARSRGLATPLGAQIDILGDRVVENLFFTFFAVTGLISLWVPVLFFARGTVTDFLRGLAARSGRSGFDHNSMLDTWWGRTLVASRASRVAYAVLKCVCFCCLGMLLPLRHLPLAQLNTCLLSAGQALTGVTAIFCLVRAIPVIWEGRRYFAAAEKAPRAVATGAAR